MPGESPITDIPREQQLVGKRALMIVFWPLELDPRVPKEARSLRRAGVSITIVAWRRRRETPRRSNHEGINVISVGPTLPRNFDRLPMVLRAAIKGPVWMLFLVGALSFALRNRFDMVHAHDLDTLPAAALIARLRGVPLIYDSHEDYAGIIEGDLGSAAGMLFGWLERRLAPRANLIVAVNHTLGQRLARYGPPVRVVMNCPDLEMWGTGVQDPERHSGDVPVAIYVGSLTHARGLPEFIRSQRYLRGRCTYRIVGDGPILPDLREIVNREKIPNIEFTGWVPQTKVPEELRRATIGVIPLQPHPNYVISTPNKLFEYMALGLPVVASDFPPIREIVEGENVGACVDATKPESIAAGIDWLLERASELPQIGFRARRLAEDRYSWKAQGNVLVEAYREVLA